MITVGAIALIIKTVGFYKEIVIAETFGLSELLDTFFIAMLIPGLVSEVFLNSFNSVFIPNYITEQKTTRNIGSFQTTSGLITISVALIFIILSFLFLDIYLKAFFSGHTQDYYDLVKLQFYTLLPCILFWGLSSLLTGLLNIYDEFLYTSFSSVVIPLSIITCLMFFHVELKDAVLATGTLIGSVLQFLILLSIALTKNVIQIDKPDFFSQNAVIMFRQVPAKISSGLISGVNPIVDQFFSAQLFIGSITALNYGNKIPSFTIGIIGMGIGTVILPYFSKHAVDNKKDAFNKLNEILKYIICGSIVLLIFSVVLSKPIIELLFERGAFEAADTLVVSKIQQMYLLQIPSYISGLVMVKFLTSINKNNFMVFASLISLTLNIILNYIFIKYMEVFGLALATSVVSLINSIVLYIYIRKLNSKDF
ncbi:murein biosynthesis integral membrane protein MurJ [Gelidibacter sediminis]|nr:lipid II flippase MurJ [Gelidibacter sediminis]